MVNTIREIENEASQKTSETTTSETLFILASRKCEMASQLLKYNVLASSLEQYLQCLHYLKNFYLSELPQTIVQVNRVAQVGSSIFLKRSTLQFGRAIEYLNRATNITLSLKTLFKNFFLKTIESNRIDLKDL